MASRTLYLLAEASVSIVQKAPLVVKQAIVAARDSDTELYERVNTLHQRRCVSPEP